MDIMESIWQRAKADPQKVAFPEATEEKILLAARECADKGICKPVLVGAVKDIKEAAAQYGISLEGIELAEAFDEEKTLALAEEHCEVFSIQERDESLESYYIRLIGGDIHE